VLVHGAHKALHDTDNRKHQDNSQDVGPEGRNHIEHEVQRSSEQIVRESRNRGGCNYIAHS